MLAKTTMLEHALAYAAQGWPVFPCDWKSGPHEKAPLLAKDKDAAGKDIPGSGGVSKATTDEAQIREWWAKWPKALIGIALGTKAGVWVVDLDPRGEPVGDVEQRLIDTVGTLPLGPRSETQSGGHHLWLKMPDGEIPKNSAKRVQNVDWRAQGGYVIAPPSVMSNGNKYTWIVEPGEAEFPEPPSRLLDLVFKRGEFQVKREKKNAVILDRPRGSDDEEAVRRYCEVALARAADKVAGLGKGSRNVELNNIALSVGHLIGPGRLSMDEADEALRQAAHTWGIGDDDKALKAGGTLERALEDGAKDPANLAHVVNKTRSRRPEPPKDLPPHDAETGEIQNEYGAGPIAERAPDIEPSDGPHENMGSDDGAAPDWQEADNKYPFRCLGHDHGTYFYFSTNKQQITALKAKEHTQLNLLQLCGLNYWADFLGIRGKISAESWAQIADSLIEGCHRKGIFVERNVRGRGAWIDGKGKKAKVVVHTGDSARIDGDIVPLSDIPGRYIYESAEPWQFEFGSPASTEQANKLAEICKRLTWADPMSGALLAGWNVIAPVCGALKWRPHIWITGPSQAGKSTAVEEICYRIVGPAAERFEGNTSEAGIRQNMGYDARPIILDEAESEDASQVARMQQILGLARIASSGGTIAKGSATGRATNFVARSCFLFSSINTALRHHADESRVTKLVLAKNDAKNALEHYHNLIRDINETFTLDYAGAMFSRTVENLPGLLDNIETFKIAAAVLFKNRRAADQLGPMLAGYYLCHSTKRITLADAEKFITRHDWTEHVALDSVGDEYRLFQYLMSRRIRMSVGGSPREHSVGQVIQMCRSDGETQGETRPYEDALGPRGIRVDYDTITISNTADGIREMLRDTPWQGDWRRPLGMIEGAEKSDGAVYFAPGLTSRAIVLPLNLLVRK